MEWNGTEPTELNEKEWNRMEYNGTEWKGMEQNILNKV